MFRTLLAASVYLWAPVALAQAAAPQALTQKDGFAVGGAIGLHEAGPTAQLDVKSPTLFSVAEGQYFSGRYSLYLDGGVVAHRNMKLEDGRYEDQHTGFVGLGLEMRRDSPSKAFSYYSRVGAEMLMPPKELTEKRQLVGAKIAFGGELPFEARTSWFGPTQTAFFSELDLHLAQPRADKLAGKPDLFNGVSLLIGSRTYY